MSRDTRTSRSTLRLEEVSGAVSSVTLDGDTVDPLASRFNAKYLGDGHILSFDSAAARQAHIDCWAGWVVS